MLKKPILSMGRDELLELDPSKVVRRLRRNEVLHIFREFGGFWSYNYKAAEEGIPGLHAELKSGRHSDGFINSHVVLCNPNICRIMAKQLVYRFEKLKIPKPVYVAGIPVGATNLGKEVAKLIGVKPAMMEKEEGKIELISRIRPEETLLLVEDFCTRGTGLKEAVNDILSKQPQAIIQSFELVIINRGGLRKIKIGGLESFKVVAAVTHRINDWEPEECPLCSEKYKSKAIKPKVSEESWSLLTKSQPPPGPPLFFILST
jgi:orotate phosphoribosyltransferase